MSNVSGIDLNLLVALDALLTECSVTRAAQRVGLSQPAMSNALSRLRDLLDDPVLVRAGNSMAPTPRALELAGPIHRALSDIGRALSPGPEFDPATSSQTFRIQSADNCELSLLPRLVERLGRLAPSVDIAFTRAAPTTEDDLRSGRIDVYLGTWFNIPGHLHSHLLHHESFVCIARKDHPDIGRRLTLRKFVELAHVLVAPSERPGSMVDTVLADQGLGRCVVLRTPHFLVAPLVVARTDLIATLPRGVATTFAEILPLSVYPPPVEVAGFPTHLVWHPRTHEQAPHLWLRKQLMELSADAQVW